MQFLNTISKNGMIQDCEVLLNFPDGGISGDATLLKQFTSLINNSYLKVVAYALGLDPKWQWDDPNYTDLPIATCTMVSGQEDYILPGSTTSADASTLMKITKVTVLDNSGKEVVLDPTDESEARLNSIYTVGGIPSKYRLIGNTIKLFPKPLSGSVTLTNGLKAYFQRSPEPFTSSDTTKQPGLPEPFHRMITLEASMDYAGSRGLPNMDYLQGKLTELKTILDGFYGRNWDSTPRLKTRVERYT